MDDYMRRCLSALATDIAEARAERATKQLMHRLAGVPLDCPMCPKPSCSGNCDQGRACDCEVQLAQMPGRIHFIEPAIHVYRIPLRRRLAMRWRLFVEAWVDPVIH
jgi:hypothetical protein